MSIDLLSQLQRTARHLSAHYPQWSMEAFSELDSTSNEARRSIDSGKATGPFVVAAAQQTAGRGRGERNWVSTPGKSLLFTAAVPLRELGTVDSAFGRRDEDYPITLWPLQMGLTIALRLRQFGWMSLLKWPNDILLEGKKVAGVLCEVRSGWFLAGIGINLLQTEEEIAQIASPRVAPSSLLLIPREPGEEFSPLQIVPSIVQSTVAVLESPWPKDRMLAYYRDWCATLGARVIVNDDSEEPLAGVATGINDDGSLSVEIDGGRVVRISNEVHEVVE